MKFNGKSIEKIGLFTRTYGNKGAIEFSPANDSRDINKKEWIVVDLQQEFVPFFVESILTKGKKLIISLKHINSLLQVETLVHHHVYGFIQNKKTENTISSAVNLIGFSAIDKKTGNNLGKFKNILENQANPLMQIVGDREILVPVNGNFIGKIDKTHKTFLLLLPDRFLDIY